MEDALAVWPGSDAAALLARAIVQVCLQMADRSVTRSTGGSRVTVPTNATYLEAFLAAHHGGLLARTGLKLLEFLREPQLSPFFVVAPSASGTISLNLDTLEVAGLRRAAEDASLVKLSATTCARSQALGV